MLGLCAIWSPRAAAQNRSLPQVTIRMDRVPMSQIMSEIERQTKYLFVTGSDVKTDRITSLDVTAVPLTEALNRMVAGADLTYDIRSLSIILSVKKAEQPAAVAGYVRDGSGQPVIGATIIVRDTSTGTTTDADGRFTLSVPAPSTAWLEVSYLGYEPQAVAVGNRTSFDITLREAASEIESVVVTALGIKRSEKALSYNAQQINAEDIVAVKDVNFVNSLNGKVAKPGAEVREGDVLEIRFGSRVGRYRIQSVKETVRKEGAQDMYEVLEEDEQTRMERGEA